MYASPAVPGPPPKHHALDRQVVLDRSGVLDHPAAPDGAGPLRCPAPPAAGLHGRDRELETIEELIDGLRHGRPGTLLISGAPGMGRTALLEAARRSAGPDLLTLGTTGIPGEKDLPFAGLHRMLQPVVHRIAALPARLRAALAVVTGDDGDFPVTGGVESLDPGWRFLLDTAVHRLLTETAAERPVLCWVDDLHLLDPVSHDALVFAARRLDGHRVLMLFTSDDGADAYLADRGEGHDDDLPALRLRPLEEGACLRLLSDRLPDRLRTDPPRTDPPRTDSSETGAPGSDSAGTEPSRTDRFGPGQAGEPGLELVESCDGNPLALIELAGELTPEQLAGEAPPPRSLPGHSRLRARYRSRMARLSPAARRLALLIAAAERLGLETLRRAAAGVDLDPAELTAVVAAGLARVDGDTAAAPGPPVRDVICTEAAWAERKAAHAALAAASEEDGDRLRCRLHRAAIVDGRDRHDSLAAGLADAAVTADLAGDFAESAAAWDRAADLTSAPERRAARLVSAATASWLAGRTRTARVRLRSAGPLLRRTASSGASGASGVSRASGASGVSAVSDASPASGPAGPLLGLAELVRGELELRDGSPDQAHRILLDAADRLAPADRGLSIGALMRAGEAFCTVGDYASYVRIAERVAALRTADDPPELRLMLDHFAGVAAVYRGRPQEAVAPLRGVVDLAESGSDCAGMIWGSMTALLLGEDLRAHGLATRAVDEAERLGAVALVPQALEFAALAELWLGRYRAAATSSLDGLRRAQAAGQRNTAIDHLAVLALLAAFHGDHDSVRVRLAAMEDHAAERGLARPGRIGAWALACLDLADDRPAEALARLRLVPDIGPDHPAVRVMAIPHLVEAAVLCRRRESALGAFEVFDHWASGVQSPGRLALSQRCRALLADTDDLADEHYTLALRLHRTSGSAFELARTELLYGGRLRRTRRPSNAREHLRNALQIFERYDAEPWAARARAELRAAGEAVDPAESPRAADLTPQQREIARLVAQGMTNKEVAARLFLSHRTIDHHLRNIFTRLEIRSRVELSRLFS